MSSIRICSATTAEQIAVYRIKAGAHITSSFLLTLRSSPHNFWRDDFLTIHEFLIRYNESIIYVCWITFNTQFRIIYRSAIVSHLNVNLMSKSGKKNPLPREEFVLNFCFLVYFVFVFVYKATDTVRTLNLIIVFKWYIQICVSKVIQQKQITIISILGVNRILLKNERRDLWRPKFYCA